MIIPALERPKINFDFPTFTLDVNQVALKRPRDLPSDYEGLTAFEYNYFEVTKVELCVTPTTFFEITGGTALDRLGSTAYDRYQKSQFFKSRPVGTTLSLSDQESNQLWTGIRQILWPKVSNDALTLNQRADATQLFFHAVTSAAAHNSAFLTVDHNFHAHAGEIQRELGVSVYRPNEAWEEFQPKYGLYSPTLREKEHVWSQQQTYLEQLRVKSSI